jgi:S-DNA-T family DNA segregation ATPase FtsK/SpoIIIE
MGTRPASGAALRIPELAPDPVLPLPSGSGGDSAALALPLGPGGDEGDVLALDLLHTGGLLVAGPPGSGRTSALDAMAVHLGARGVPVLRIAAPGIAGPAAERVNPHDRTAVRRWLASLDGAPGVVLADDVGTPAEATALVELPPPSDGGPVLVAASTAGHLGAHYQGAVAALRRSRTGLLLTPQPGDADLLGVRLPRTPVPARPGSGWLVRAGAAQRVQVARRRGREAADAAR